MVSPAWFSDYVLSVGAVDSGGSALVTSNVAGPWVSIAAPGTDIVGLSPRDDELRNAIQGPNNSLLLPAGSSFSTAIASGVAALVHAKYPQLTSHQVIEQLIRTATKPAGGANNQIGCGGVDPLGELTKNVPQWRSLTYVAQGFEHRG